MLPETNQHDNVFGALVDIEHVTITPMSLFVMLLVVLSCMLRGERI